MRLDVGGLRYRRGGFFLDASISLESGKTGVIVGPSGCGKTTLLRLIAGLETPESGSIVLGGRSLDGLPPERRRVGFVFQDLALFDHMDGRANIAYGLVVRGMARQEAYARVGALARSLRIEHLLDRRPASLSGGERQRLAFARALAADPDLLLLDEPLSSLDASLRKDLRAYLRSHLLSRGTTALHVTHDVEEALELADTIFVMRAGRIVASGSPEALFAAPPDAWTARFLAMGPLLRARILSGSEGFLEAATGFGTFRVPERGDRREDRRGGKRDGRADPACYLHFARKTAKIAAPRGEADTGADLREAFFDAVLVRGVFEGGFRRLVLAPSGESSETIEIETDAGFDPSPGEKLRISVPMDDLRLLSSGESGESGK
ncbi:MAG: ABC transporter ATP-binding protein [Rectinemataceae bacterium]